MKIVSYIRSFHASRRLEPIRDGVERIIFLGCLTCGLYLSGCFWFPVFEMQLLISRSVNRLLILNLVFAMEVCVCLDIYGAWEGARITA